MCAACASLDGVRSRSYWNWTRVDIRSLSQFTMHGVSFVRSKNPFARNDFEGTVSEYNITIRHMPRARAVVVSVSGPDLGWRHVKPPIGHERVSVAPQMGGSAWREADVAAAIQAVRHIIDAPAGSDARLGAVLRYQPNHLGAKDLVP